MGTPAAPDEFAGIVAVYEDVCLKTFPDDAALITRMEQLGWRPLSPDAVKVTMGDDPARGWQSPTSATSVWLEFPPYHACSVRWNAPQRPDPAPYEAAKQRYVAAYRARQPQPSAQDGHWERDLTDANMHVDVRYTTLQARPEARDPADLKIENLMFVAQSLNDPERRAAGETGYVLRFVHQLPPAGDPNG
ncbi:hypothetical protein MTR62_15145 [Novosphingobium sp. 1949]|uniref:Uncharacterized protein n=1 Tax=Novosphingobium organovorum TaxID=2930092 RepID=A0ABT0BGF8_9SPHN|nr:hypothetical protein [Novosphingobium organovorum]MCJ2184020.1 hypothetical protein [Novosphingobium organovorum]